MSAIDVKYQEVKKANPWIGEPTGPEQVCGDGKGRFREYKGGASIYWTQTTDAHLIYGLIRAKWIALGREKGPNGYPITDEADAGSGKGRFNNFVNGTIIWKLDTPEAFSVYGAIYGKWGTVQYDMGPLGFPLNDENAAPVTGRFNDFEHGAIYYNATTGTHIVRSPILEAWRLQGGEQGVMKFPVSDTPTTTDSQGAYKQKFQGGYISCTEGSSRSIVTGSTLTTRIDAWTRAAFLDDSDDPHGWRKLPIMWLNRALQLKTALVIFRGSYTRSIDDAEIEKIKSSYAQAITRIADLSFGLGRIEHTVVVESALKKTDFVDVIVDTSTFRDISPTVYSKVTAALQAAKGLSVDAFDIVAINIPWADTATDKGGLAWSNPTHRFVGNNKTWSTVHYIHPGPSWGDKPAIWWAYYVHETLHILEWMLEDHGYPQLRKPDDPWWEASYPHLTSSTVDPPPENLMDPGDPRHYAMLQRIKSDWFNLHPTWGQLLVLSTIPPDYGKFLMYSCPDRRTLVETAWHTTSPLK